MAEIADLGVGNFISYELHTINPRAALSFYESVAGWTSQPANGGHRCALFSTARGVLGGVAQLSERAKKLGVPPHWMGSVSVSDVDATIAEVTRLGGRVRVEPVDLPDIGRQAVIADPFGAVIGVCTPTLPVMMREASHGEVCWHELFSEDHEASFAFYSKIFGWKSRSRFDKDVMCRYLLYGNDERDMGGMFSRPKEQHVSAWNYYIQVSDLDAAVVRAKLAGGTLYEGPMIVPSGARIAVLGDPDGVGFSLHENPKASAPRLTDSAQEA
jgi:uncharacterized protein